MRTRLSNIFKTTNVTNLAKVIQESPYRVLQVTFKQKTLKESVYFLKIVEFCPIFDIQIDITSAIFREQLQNHTFQKAHRSLSKHTNIYINRATHYEIKNIKHLCFFGGSFFKKILLTFRIFDESNIWAKVYHIEKVRCRVVLLLKLRAVKVTTSFH